MVLNKLICLSEVIYTYETYVLRVWGITDAMAPSFLAVFECFNFNNYSPVYAEGGWDEWTILPSLAHRTFAVCTRNIDN